MKSCCIRQSLENWQENNNAFYQYNILIQMIDDAHFRTPSSNGPQCSVRSSD